MDNSLVLNLQMMLRTRPTLKYCGLTIVLSNSSRFDRLRLLSANGGQLFNDFCLRPEYNQMQCDVRLADDMSPLLQGTKCILVMGEYAMHKLIPESRQNTLNEMRGTVFIVNDIPHIPTFTAQDAADMIA